MLYNSSMTEQDHGEEGMGFEHHHIALSVTDLDKSIEFYSTLRFKTVLEWEADDKSLKIAHLKGDGGFLELFCYKSPQEAPESIHSVATDLPVVGTKHFGLRVKSLEEAKKYLVRKDLMKDDVQITQGRTGIQYFFIEDPDGILVEIVQDDREL